jgi:hypothetical protein
MLYVYLLIVCATRVLYFIGHDITIYWEIKTVVLSVLHVELQSVQVSLPECQKVWVEERVNWEPRGTCPIPARGG